MTDVLKLLWITNFCVVVFEDKPFTHLLLIICHILAQNGIIKKLL